MFLRTISFLWDKVEDTGAYPFSLPAFRGLEAIDLNQPVTFFVGENGSGKSTLLESVAAVCGFNLEGGSRNQAFTPADASPGLERCLRLSWHPKTTRGFFFRAESFHKFATYLDEEDPAILMHYGGRSLHEQSHGESFLSLVRYRFGTPGIYLMDEPEAALSPSRQLAFLRAIWQLEQEGAQWIIATHSPILLAYPHAEIFSFDKSPLTRVSYEETEHYQLTRQFLNNPQVFFRHLLSRD